MTAQILTQEYLHTIFEYKDGELYWKNNNHAKKNKGNIAGYISKSGYRAIRKNGKYLLAHRLIFMMFHGYLPKEIDHINRIRHDNRIENLRACTKSENHFNRSMDYRNTSGYKNVTWHKKLNKWQVGLNIKGKFYHFGTYFNVEVANFVAETMRHKYHKNFANNGK
jgi:hypothetical protein